MRATIRLLASLLGLAVLVCSIPVQSKSDQKCPESMQAVDICTLISNPPAYDGKELLIRGQFRVVIHGSIMTGAGCKETSVNMRQAYNWKADKHAKAVLQKQMKKLPYQFVELVVRGTFRSAGQEGCFGQQPAVQSAEDLVRQEDQARR